MRDTTTPRGRQADPTLLRIRLFERMQAETLTGESVLPVGAKTRAILAILALSDRKPVLRSHISELLWSRRPEELARASLRQDIHRLLDALSPLGVDVIDVQRHTLTLKPALTSVDAERLLTANTRTLDALLPENPDFLHELNGIDPAFDDWLANQRERIVLHVRKIYEARLQDTRDPDDLDQQAQRLLAFDAYNDLAWRARMHAAVLRGDDEAARNLADLAAQTFGQDGQHVPDAATRTLIDAVSRGEAMTDLGSDAPEADEFRARPDEWTVAETTPRRSPHVHASVMILPFENRIGPQEAALAAELRDTLELQFVALDGIRVQGRLNEIPADENVFLAICKASGVDYAIDGSVQIVTNTHKIRLIVRVLDIRDGGSVSVGTYRDLDIGDARNRNQVVAELAQCLKWDLLLAEARQVAHVPVSERNAASCVSSAFQMMSRRDALLFPEVDALLQRAREQEPEHPLLAVLNCMSLHLQAFNDWTDAGEALFKRITGAQYEILDGNSQSSGSDVVMAYAMFLNPALQNRARALFEGIEQQGRAQLYVHTMCYRFCRVLDALLKGDTAVALAEVERMQAACFRSPLHDLFDPLIMYVRLLGPRRPEVIARGRTLLALYPRFPSPLVPYFVALVLEESDREEIAFVRDHLLRFSPTLTAERLLGRLAMFTPSHRALIEEALIRGGIPRGSAQ